MELEKLDKILESILFVAGSGVEISEILEKLELQESELETAIERLQKKYYAVCGIHLIRYKNKLQFSSNPKYADFVAAVLNPIREKELTRATLEVAAIIAYKQPVTRLEIEQIRGVNSEYAVHMLSKFNLIQVVGRKEVVGRPLLFATTEEFLKRFQIKDLDELPDYDELIERIKVLHKDDEPEDSSLFDHFEIPEDEEIPEFLKNEPDINKVTADQSVEPSAEQDKTAEPDSPEDV